MNKIWMGIDSTLQVAIEDLRRLCSFQSMAVEGRHMQETADHVRSLLHNEGFRTQIWSFPGAHPVVFGELKGRAENALMFYNHYDVQPPGSREKWESDPFQVVEKNGYLFGRGVADNKGNIIARLLAIRAWREAGEQLPVTIKWFIEGDEEIGSPHLGSILHGQIEHLQAQGCVWEGGSKDVEGRPTLYFGAKGLCIVELEATGMDKDVHSSMAAIIPNPAWRLVWALDSMRSGEDKITIDGFFDDVIEPEEAALKAMEILAPMGERIKENLKLKRFVKDLQGPAAVREYFFAPSMTLCGLEGGYTGPGHKMVIPTTATAKVDLCLVPRQRAADIAQKIQKHLKNHGFSDVGVRVLSCTTDPGATPLNHRFSMTFRTAAEKAYGTKPVLFPVMPSPGPYGWFRNFLGIPTISAGVGHFNSNIHAPNENIRISDLAQGSKLIATLISEFSQMEK